MASIASARSFRRSASAGSGSARAGMGAATVRLFAAAGANVIVVDRDAQGAALIAAEVGAGAPLVGDIVDSVFCDEAVETAVERTGRLDVLVNCAGTIVRADADNTSDEEWLRVMNVNVSGSFYMARAAVRVM